MEIKNIIARQILDSRGNPTVEADVWLSGGMYGRAAVPSGASTGVHEAVELRDGGDDFHGLGVNKAIHNIENEIKELLVGIRADDQFRVDRKMIELDGTDNKSRLGANATLAVSLAVAHAAAKERGIILYQHINDIAHNPQMSMPMPMMNVLNGGKHALGSADFQEFMIIPKKARTYAEAVKIGSEIFQTIKKILLKHNVATTVGDEGGFTYPIQNSNKELLELLTEATEQAGYSVGHDIVFGLDIAASEFYKEQQYMLSKDNLTLNSNQMVEYIKQLAHEFPIVSIEDGLAEDDWQAWTKLTSELSDVQLVGDDLLVTNQSRLERAINEQAANAILIKPNQIGTLTETVQSVKLAKEHNWNTIISHRSGETEDVTIAHIAVGLGAGQIKTGSLSRGERTAKHNELMRIESIERDLKLENPFS